MESIQKQDIVLPIELASGKYSLEEIGAIFVLMTVPSLDKDTREMWNENEDLMDILEVLISLGIAKTEEVDGNINLVVEI